MDTEGIKLFVRAAELLNIGAAGRQLRMAPAVASAKLAKLEKQLGADLLHRSTRKVSLSLEGAEFLPFAREILAQENAAHAALGKSSDEITGTVRFAASSTFTQLYIAPVLPRFLSQYPKINLELKLSDAQTNLIEGGFDLALRNYAIEDSNLRARRLAKDKRILCASPNYLKAHGPLGMPEQLRAHQLLLFINTTAKKLISKHHSSVFTFPPSGTSGRIIFDDGASMKEATIAGAGISMNSLWSVKKEIEQKRLVRVLPEYFIEDQSAIWLVYPKSNVLTAKVRVLIDFLIENLGSPPPWE